MSVDADKAARRIQPGRRILIGSGAAEPNSLVDAMVRASHLRDCEVVHLLTLGPAPYVSPEHAERFRHIAFFIGANTREAVQQGRADFMPVFLSEIPRLIRERRVRIDVALIQVSPPDAHGYVSLGVSVDVVRAAVDTAPLVIAEVNPRMPRTLGDAFLHVDQLAERVDVDCPLPELLADPPDPVAEAIGHHVASLIEDGATLQVGIGAIPNAVLAALSHHKDLGIHTEMLSDGVMALARAGNITGRRKAILRGKMVTSFVMGSKALYDWVDDNPSVEMRPSEYTNDPDVIARNPNMVAINAALAVDLTGQVQSDSLQGRLYSGIGGQVDFIRGAARSPGGKPIIALRSTAEHGRISRILPALEPGAGVVTSRGDVHYVVTEYGVADLWGKSVRERAIALTSIAHPDFRSELLAAAKQRRYVFGDEVLPRGASYLWREERRLRLPTREEITLRPLRVTDERALQDFFYALSDESTYRRFLGTKRTHSRQEMQQLVDVDYERNMAVVAIQPDSEAVLGVIRYDVSPATRLAEISYAVRDDWQGRGVGTAMMRRMIEIAQARGLAGFTADIQVGNAPALGLFLESGLALETRQDAGVYHVVGRFAAPPG